MSHQITRGFAKKKKEKKNVDKSQKIPLIQKLSIRSDRYKYMSVTKKNTSNSKNRVPFTDDSPIG